MVQFLFLFFWILHWLGLLVVAHAMHKIILKVLLIYETMTAIFCQWIFLVKRFFFSLALIPAQKHVQDWRWFREQINYPKMTNGSPEEKTHILFVQRSKPSAWQMESVDGLRKESMQEHTHENSWLMLLCQFIKNL